MYSNLVLDFNLKINHAYNDLKMFWITPADTSLQNFVFSATN